MSEMIDMWKKKQNAFGIVYSWFLAKAYTMITLRRTWGKMPLWHKTKLLYSFLFQAFFLPSPEDLNKMSMEMNDNDMLTLVVQEMSKQFPTLMETLVEERDHSHHSVVAVVGKGHLQGIKKYWLQPNEVDKLMEIPSNSAASSVTKIFKSVGVAIVFSSSTLLCDSADHCMQIQQY
ncbi:hypothetical protein V2J09_008059 [Rumex salicifolius]